MARRSKNQSKGNLIAYALITTAVLCGIILGKLYLNKRSEHFSGISELPISDYKQNPNSLSGNIYQVTGKISEKLKWTPDQGQLISVFVDQKSQGKGTIGIRIPAQITNVNLERGHVYTFKVSINRAGLPIAQDVRAK